MSNTTTICRSDRRTALVLCHCLQVSESDVVNAIALHGLNNLRDVRHCTGAGTGCNSCHRKIIACLATVRERELES